MSEKSTTPTSLVVERKCLAEQHLPFRKYLESGYTYYREWLQMVLGLDDVAMEHLNFDLARHINLFAQEQTKTKTYPMGVDLEVRYIVTQLEKVLGHDLAPYRDALHNTLQSNLALPEIAIDQYVKQYVNLNPTSSVLRMTDAEFNRRLHDVPENILDEHSLETWRNPRPDQLNAKPYPVARRDIMAGEPIGPPASRNIGLQFLVVNGFIDSKTFPLDIKRKQHHAVTYF